MSAGDIVWADDAYDDAYASDGISRFGSYIRQREHLLVDDWEPLSRAAFAATVWGIATSPVMSPGYVQLRSDVWAVTCRHGEEPGVLVAELEIRLRWPAALRRADALAGWGSWDQSRTWDGEEQLLCPADHRPAMLVSSRLLVPIAEALLPLPSRIGAVDVAVAKRAVRAICAQVNAHAVPVVAQLREGIAAGAGR